MLSDVFSVAYLKHRNVVTKLTIPRGLEKVTIIAYYIFIFAGKCELGWRSSAFGRQLQKEENLKVNWRK